ncbi:MAG TPA: PE-PPE domain-containing protein, partial [Mycobacterium sp.]|nr:PE-PPE domain-containing protein [Mycobacterium sp.]
NAPADLLNIVAHVNSLVAYLYGYQDQDEVDLPVNADGTPAVSCGNANTCAVLASGGDAVPCDDARCETPDGDRVVAYVTTRGNTTYVTYTTDELPLARLIRDAVPLGGAIADLTEPLLKLIADSAYYGGNPIPSDPSRYRPARLAPSLGEVVSTVSKVPGAIHEGLEALSDNPSEDEATRDLVTELTQAADESEPRPDRDADRRPTPETEPTQDDGESGEDDTEQRESETVEESDNSGIKDSEGPDDAAGAAPRNDSADAGGDDDEGAE